MKIITRGEAMRIHQQHPASRLFPFCTGKYRWHGSAEAYTGRELMFRHPENEYDWLSSDAAVDEVLLINEYTFTEAGLRAG